MDTLSTMEMMQAVPIPCEAGQNAVHGVSIAKNPLSAGQSGALAIQFTQGALEVIGEEQMIETMSQRPLTVKFGMDPSAPDLHLGHGVVLRKLRQFQLAGHHVVIIIGDFTGRIGDPTGRNKMRPALDEAQVIINAQTYQQQLWRVLDPALTQVVYNSTWLSQLRFDAIVKLCSHTTVARMLERDDFENRFQTKQPIGLHEFLYPLMQAYDSVALQADVELGGMDQRFNILMGRALQRDMGQPPQTCIFMPLLVGLDGSEKMSKSLGNHVGLDEDAASMFAKLMHMPDNCILDYARLATDMNPQQISHLQARLEAGENPRDVKLDVAESVTALYHPSQAAQERRRFIEVYSHGVLPEEMAVLQWSHSLAHMLLQAGWAPSLSQARRLIRQGGVRWDGEKVHEDFEPVTCGVLQAGKGRFVRVEIH